jgi:thiosulfate/3-mercaptopyruvate sulfurtransferase
VYTTLIQAEDVWPRLDDPAWALIDCRMSPPAASGGRAKYLASHIPGAVHAHMEEDLSAPATPGRTGRHPLPDSTAFVEKVAGFGIDAEVQVVVYDDSSGSNAARLWWMLRWVGHDRAAVLDGGWPAWQAAGYPVRSGVEVRSRRRFTPRVRPELVVDASQVEQIREDRGWRLIDTRAADRFRGENETVDPVAGHIPGAISAPFAQNLERGRFRPAGELRARFSSLIGDTPIEKVVCYCGSGVTAGHDILAMVHAGLGLARLYPGSWSDWITDPERPVAR